MSKRERELALLEETYASEDRVFAQGGRRDRMSRRQFLNATLLGAGVAGLYYAGKTIFDMAQVQPHLSVGRNSLRLETVPEAEKSGVTVPVVYQEKEGNYPELRPLSERYKTQQEIEKQRGVPYYYAEALWADMEERFSLDSIRNHPDRSTFTPLQIQLVMKQRRDAMDTYLRRVHAPLNETVSSSQRAHIDIEHAIKTADENKDEFGLDYDPLIDDPQILNARLLLQMGFYVEGLLSGSRKKAVTSRDRLEKLHNEDQGLEIYLPLNGDEGVTIMKEAYARSVAAITDGLQILPGQFSLVDNNELDIMPVITPEEVAHDYYAKAFGCQEYGIDLRPSACALDQGKKRQTNGFHPSLEAMLQEKRKIIDGGGEKAKLVMQLNDGIRGNIYPRNVDDARSTLMWLDGQIAGLNQKYALQQKCTEIQEMGVSPFPYQTEFGTVQEIHELRKANMIPVFSAVTGYRSPNIQLETSSIFSMPYNVPGDNPGYDGHTYQYYSEKDLWPMVIGWLQSQK